MKNLVALAFFCVIFAAMSLAQSEKERQTSEFDKEHTEWIATALRSMQAIKVGMTRSELMKVFTTEGGLEFKSATTAQKTFVYRKCPYIKVDVKLAISGPNEDLPTDKITEISRPYLAWRWQTEGLLKYPQYAHSPWEPFGRMNLLTGSCSAVFLDESKHVVKPN